MLDRVIIGAPADGRSGYFWEELKKRNFMHAKRQSSSETTHVIEATIGHLREKFSSRFHEAEAVSNVRKFPFLEFSLPAVTARHDFDR